MWLSALAFAQAPSAEGEDVEHSHSVSALPDAFLGAWTPLGRGYLAMGDLTFDRQTLSWGVCQNAPYVTLRRSAEAYLIQFLLVTPACHLSGEASFLIIEPAAQGIEASMCRDPTEFNKVKAERACSHGMLARQDRN